MFDFPNFANPLLDDVRAEYLKLLAEDTDVSVFACSAIEELMFAQFHKDPRRDVAAYKPQELEILRAHELIVSLLKIRSGKSYGSARPSYQVEGALRAYTTVLAAMHRVVHRLVDPYLVVEGLHKDEAQAKALYVASLTARLLEDVPPLTDAEFIEGGYFTVKPLNYTTPDPLDHTGG